MTSLVTERTKRWLAFMTCWTGGVVAGNYTYSAERWWIDLTMIVLISLAAVAVFDLLWTHRAKTSAPPPFTSEVVSGSSDDIPELLTLMMEEHAPGLPGALHRFAHMSEHNVRLTIEARPGSDRVQASMNIEGAAP